MEGVYSELPKLFSAVVVGLVTALLTVRLALSRFRSEQWWLRRAESYSAVFGALHDMKMFLKATTEDQIGNVAQPPERLSRLLNKWQGGEDNLAKAIDMGLLLFSPQSIVVLERLQQELLEQSISDFSWDHAQARLERIEACLTALRELAILDLKVR
jgi:hypothetical protein